MSWVNWFDSIALWWGRITLGVIAVAAVCLLGLWLLCKLEDAFDGARRR